jgi:hypothetical protein
MRYSWNDPGSAITSLEVEDKAASGIAEAVVYLNPDLPEDSTSVATIYNALSANGLTITYDVKENAPILRVTGHKNANKLLATLQENETVKGEASKEKLTNSGKKENWFESWKLTISAGFYQLGNLATYIGGWFRNDKDEMRTGLAFMVGDSTMLLFGKRNQEEKYQDIVKGFGEFLDKSGFGTSHTSIFNEITQPANVSNWQKLRNFMYDKVIAIKSVSEVIAGTSFAMAGFKQGNIFKGAAGTIVGSGFGIGMLIPEKSPKDLREEFGVSSDEEVKQKISQMPLFKRMKYKIQTNPLIISGGAAGLNNALTLYGALDERSYFNKNKKSRKVNEIEAKLEGKSYKPSIFEAERTAESAVLKKVESSAYYDKIYLDQTSITNHRNGSAPLNEEKLKALRTNVNERMRAINIKEGREDPTEGFLKENDPQLVDQLHDRILTEIHHAGEDFHQKKQTVINLRDAKKKLEKGRTLQLGKKKITFNQSGFWKFNVAQSLFFGAANLIYASASKHGDQSKATALTNRFIAAVATQALIMEEAYRPEFINIASYYANKNSNINLTSDEVRAALNTKIKALTNHPIVKLHEQERAKYYQVEVEIPIEANASKDTETPPAPSKEEKRFADSTPQTKSHESKDLSPASIKASAEEGAQQGTALS